MGVYKDLAIQQHNRRRRPLRLAIYDRPNAGDRITNALDHLEMFILPDVTDRISYDYIVSQLRKAITMIEGENTMESPRYMLYHVNALGAPVYQAAHNDRHSARDEYQRDCRSLASGQLRKSVVEVCVYKGDDVMWSSLTDTNVKVAP